MENKDGVYSCLLIKSLAPDALIVKIEKLQDYRNSPLNTCRLLAGEHYGINENLSFALTICDYLCKKHKYHINNEEYENLLKVAYHTINQIEELIKKEKKRRF